MGAIKQTENSLYANLADCANAQSLWVHTNEGFTGGSQTDILAASRTGRK